MRIGARLILAASLLVLSQASLARETLHDLTVDAAMQSAGNENVGKDIAFYMAGQNHPAVEQTLGQFTSKRASNGFGKSDEDACARAFLSAIIAFQDRARQLGGNAVVDIKSITNGGLTSATSYRCVSGSTHSNVGLSGSVVKLK